jgi:hypothetical protein
MTIGRIMDEQGFFLRCSHFMQGIAEAWQCGNTVYVSPALFQLLTDEDDMNTIYAIAGQFILRKVSLRELMELVKRKASLRLFREERHKIVRFQIVREV